MVVIGIFGHFTISIMMTKNINIALPSIVCPVIMNFIFLIISDYRNDIYIGFILYSFFTFPLINLFGWLGYFLMEKLNCNNYLYSSLIGAIFGIFAVLLVTFGDIMKSPLGILWFAFVGSIMALIFRFLMYFRKSDNLNN